MTDTVTTTTIIDLNNITNTQKAIVYFKDINWHSESAYYLYWLPLTLCIIGYFIKLIYRCKNDIENKNEYIKKYNEWFNKYNREDKTNIVRKPDEYEPEVTIGTIIAYIVISCIPLVNILYFIFDICRTTILEIFEKLCKVPLIAKPKLPTAKD